MTDREYGWGIVGCGVIAPTHARAVAALPNAHLVAVTDVNPGKAKALADSRGAARDADLGALLARPDIDVVSVCVPSGLHAEVGVQAAQAGKHLVIEKPIDVTDPGLLRQRRTGAGGPRGDPGRLRFRPAGPAGHTAVAQPTVFRGSFRVRVIAGIRRALEYISAFIKLRR